MSGLPQAIAILEATFDEYAGKEGDSTTLTKNELSLMLHTAFPGATGPNCERFFQNLDCDGDGVVNYQEFIIFVATLCTMLKGK